MRKEKNVHKMLKAKENFGITLVALIITIVVLLILAVVSIGAIRDSDIIGHSKTAQSLYTEAQEKENVSLSVLQAHTVGSGKIIQLNLQDALDDYFGENETWLTDNASKNDSYFLIVVKSSGRQYRVYYNGKIETITEEYSLTNTPYQVNIEKEYDETENKVKVTITDNLYKEDGSLNYDILTIEDSIDIITAKKGLTLDSSKDKLEEFILKFANEGLQASYNSYEALVQTYIDMGELSEGATKYDALNLLLKQAWGASYNNQTIQELASKNFDGVIRYRVIDGVEIKEYVGDGSDYWKIEENGTWEYGLKVEFKVNGETIFSKKAEKLLEVTEIFKYELRSGFYISDDESVALGVSKSGLDLLFLGSASLANQPWKSGLGVLIGGNWKLKVDGKNGKIEQFNTFGVNKQYNINVYDEDGIKYDELKRSDIKKYYTTKNLRTEAGENSKYTNFTSGFYASESGKLIYMSFTYNAVFGFIDNEELNFSDSSHYSYKLFTDGEIEMLLKENDIELLKDENSVWYISHNNETYTLLDDISQYFE